MACGARGDLVGDAGFARRTRRPSRQSTGTTARRGTRTSCPSGRRRRMSGSTLGSGHGHGAVWLQVGKPRRAPGGVGRQRQAVQRTPRRIKASKLRPTSVGKTARGHGTAVTPCRLSTEGKALEGDASVGKWRMAARQRTVSHGNPVDPRIVSGMQQAHDVVGGASRQGGEKPRRRNRVARQCRAEASPRTRGMDAPTA